MKQIATWFKSAVTKFLDPERESRVQALVRAIERGIRSQGPRFALEQALLGREFADADLHEAKLRVYRGALERGWSDGVLNAGEQKTARWLAEHLQMSEEESRKVDVEQARRVFGVALSESMQDGLLDSKEEARLRAIASAVGSDLAQFMRAFFQNEGEAFLRSIFLSCIADNELSQGDWDYLLHVTQQFGLQAAEMLEIIQPQARQFVEHVLADAKSDGRLSDSEHQTLSWMVSHLHLPPDFQSYALREIQQLQALTNIADGRLPSISMPTGMEHRSGEIVHWVGYVTWREYRARKDGVHSFDHRGVLAMTDHRLVFSGGEKSQTFGYRKIVAHSGAAGWLQIQAEGKAASQFLFHEPNPIAYAIFCSAVAMANQTKLARVASGDSRHIPREVRQRVWQRYGGRCAECGATAYLEFDHIIPVAKGGSNSDGNVQLLCRMCNLKKSDAI